MKVNTKNKKWILGIAAGVIVIILAIIIANYPKSEDKSKSNEEKEAVVTDQATDSSEETTEDNKVDENTDNASDEEEPLEKNKVEVVNTLISDYMAACKKGNMDKIEKLVSTGDELTKEQVQKPYEYVEKIQNIDCYTLSGPEEGSYIVYVYYELKFVNIDTVAPGLMQLYVSTTSDDSLVIMLNELEQEVADARDKALDREDVQKLIKMVNTKLTEAANADSELKELITKLNQSDDDAAKATTAPKATAKAETEAKATKAPEATTEAKATKAPKATEKAEATKAPEKTAAPTKAAE